MNLPSSQRAVLADERMKSARQLTHTVYEKLAELAEANRESFEKFYGQLVLVSGGTIALSVTYLGYLKSTKSAVVQPSALWISWISLLVCLLLSVFANFFYSHYLTYSRQSEYAKRLAEQFDTEADELPYVGHLPPLSDEELKRTCDERRETARKRRSDSEWNKKKANVCWFVWRWGGLGARCALVLGMMFLVAFAIANFQQQSTSAATTVAYQIPSGGTAPMTNVPCNPLFDGWRLTISWQRYIFLYCLAVALGFRIIHSLLRARAVQKGDFPHTDDRKEAVEVNFWKAFRYCFLGDSKFKEHSDLWIPFAIGLIELAAFPILLVLGQVLVIGGWLGIKTAGSWIGWQASRTSFNRFLLFSLLNLSVSYLWLSHYVQRLACP